jgi:hypothetical protein
MPSLSPCLQESFEISCLNPYIPRPLVDCQFEQAVHFFMTAVDMPRHMNAQEIFCLIIAAALHDYRHPGVTERFCVDAAHELAMVYNDVYVMEHFHAAAAFQVRAHAHAR